MTTKRVGMIVPSSNTTMETEIPAMLRARAEVRPDEQFTFHSSRMRMQHVTPEQLTQMDADSLRCAAELADARVDAMAYACLVAIMAQSRGYHAVSESKLAQVAKEESGEAIPVLSSAGALTEALAHLDVRKIAVVTPYMKPLTATVCDYIEHEGFEVVDSLSLEVADNLAVGRLDPRNLLEHARTVDTSGAQALVISACVQMPSLPILDELQQQFDIPVLSAAAATTWRVLRSLDLDPVVPRAGALLAP
ncbi:maleate cis-trans isomerase family protein [Nocardia coffeae]|uniref:maleate cis-trans isomerase family protein n=1 Tax=Nocardia coffeae TaxID=2873381 RepID=UPI0027E05995|nr:Asp/Glu racemase [Nocardia coffeae]